MVDLLVQVQVVLLYRLMAADLVQDFLVQEEVEVA
jgi:hypothetical protein